MVNLSRKCLFNEQANCQTHGAEFEAAKTQERDARKQVRTKRAEISTLQDVIDKAKNAVAIDEIDNRVWIWDNPVKRFNQQTGVFCFCSVNLLFMLHDLCPADL